MSPSMTRKYRYSNTKFWLLMTTCLAVLFGSAAYHLVSIRTYERYAHDEFSRAVTMILRTADQLLIIQPKASLQLLADSTVGKLQYFSLNPPPLETWLGVVFDRFLQQSAMICSVAVYTERGKKLYQRGESACLPSVIAPDAFCVDDDTPGLRISVPVYTQNRVQQGTFSAFIAFPLALFHDIEHDFDLRLSILSGEHLLYGSPDMMLTTQPPNRHILAPDEPGRTIRSTPDRVFSRRGLWYSYTIQLGEHPIMLLRGYRSGNFLVWKVIEAGIINSLLLGATLVLFSYFHINYKYISHAYRAVIDGMADWLCFKDTSGAYQIINQTMARTLFDLHPKEVIGKRDAELLTTGMAAQCTDTDREVLTTQHTIHITEAGQTASGQFVVLDVLKTPMIHESGKFGGVIVCARDISEHTRLQAILDALEESYFSSEWILSKLFQTMPEFLYVKDRQHRFVRASQSICDFYQRPEVAGLTDFDLYPPEQAKGYWADEETLLLGHQESFTKTEHAVVSDGKVRHILTTKTLFRDKQGNIAGLLGIGRDITELMDKQTAMEYVIAQITAQTLQQVEQMKKRQTDSIQEKPEC